jgi:hypothetical protein
MPPPQITRAGVDQVALARACAPARLPRPTTLLRALGPSHRADLLANILRPDGLPGGPGHPHKVETSSPEARDRLRRFAF